jgi:hypothetical protein
MEKEIKYFYGFDYLRAVLCIFVVSWHNFLFGVPTYFNQSAIDKLSPTLSDIIYFNILLLAVPTFLQMSIFLYLLSRKLKSINYFIKRMLRYSSLLLFWSVMVLLYRYMLGWKLTDYFSDLSQTTITLISGGRSIFYYFFCLLFLTAFAEAYYICTAKITRHKNVFIIGSFFLSIIIMIAAPHVFAILELPFNFRNPINFIPYVFSAFLLIDLSNRKNPNTIAAALFLLYMVFSLCDWLFLKYYIWNTYLGFIVPPYTRISLVFGAMFLVQFFLQPSHPPTKVITFLSQYSLGIYCFHSLIPADRVCKLFSLSSSRTLFIFLVQIVGSIILTAVYKRIPLLRQFV